MLPVLAAVTDLFFLAQIQQAAKNAGLPFALANSNATALEKARAGASILILDLNDRTLSPIDLITQIKSDPALAPLPILGFLSHVHADLKRQALDAGADQVLARSAFASSLPAILARYNG
jgi:CheY-like chemotaxis protein